MDKKSDLNNASQQEPHGHPPCNYEEQFHLLASSTENHALILLDPDCHVSDWNTGAQRLTGYEREEIIGQSLSVFYTNEDVTLGRPSEDIRQARSSGRHESDGWRVKRDESWFLAHVVLTALRTDRGKLRGYALIIHNVSTRAQLEERFRRVVDAAPSAMIMINDTGRISMVNLQAERMFGYSREELLGQSVDILVPERFRVHHPDMRGSFFKNPRSRPMGAGRDLFALRKGGSEFAVEIGLNPIETEDGPMVLSAIVDISTRKGLEKRFRQVVESAPNGMVMINMEGRIEMVNVQAERVFGYSRNEMLGQPVEMLVPERFRNQHPGLRNLFFTDPKSRPMGAGRDLYALRKDGSEFAVEIGLNPIETEEGPMVLSAIVDISDRKSKEERIKEALQEKDILLREIHHRVKNNLQIVHSLLDLQLTRIEDSAIVEMLQETQNRIQSMALIHQTLYQSQDFSGVDFRFFLENLVSMLSASYGLDAGRIRMSIDSVDVLLPLNIAIPCGLLVNELITNSLKHAFPDDRPGEIRISLTRIDGDRVGLVASDDGVGIPASLDLANTGSLGIKLVNLLSEQIDGEISIRRENPTEFTVVFPISG